MILVTNDDGVKSSGIISLSRAVSGLDEVFVVAPEREMSGSSHSLTLDRPLRSARIDEHTVSVDGTPTDCVLVAVHEILGRKPDLVISGINQGPNLGDDVTYSGTVAAALEAALLSIPSVAISLTARSDPRFETAADFACLLVEKLRQTPLPLGVFLNINVPNLPKQETKGVAVTRLGRRSYADVVSEELDPEGSTCYWIKESPPSWGEIGIGTDFAAVEAGKISMSPLLVDMTNHTCLPKLREWGRSLETAFNR